MLSFMLDIEKAFDAVWHDAILHKLKLKNTPSYLLKVIASFLSDRISFVEISSKRSEFFEITAGVPQGSPLSPYLFNIYINDIPIPKNCKIGVYANDTCILTSAKNGNLPLMVRRLERGFKLIQNHLLSWKVKINAAKTEAIVFSRSTKTLSQKPQNIISFDDLRVEWSNSVRYLGFHLDPRLTLGNHINIVHKKANQAISTLYCLLRKFSYLKSVEKVRIYRTYMRPIFTYACPVYANCAKTHVKKLQILQNKCLRMALCARYRTKINILHKRSNIPTVREFIDKLERNFITGCASSENKLIRDLCPP